MLTTSAPLQSPWELESCGRAQPPPPCALRLKGSATAIFGLHRKAANAIDGARPITAFSVAMYRSLNADKVTETIETLARRISERFPGSGLWKVCMGLVEITRQTSDRIVEVARPHWGLRVILTIIQLTTLAMLAVLAKFAMSLRASDELSDFLQGLDAAISLAIFVGGAALFVWTFEARWKRDRALKALHELRAIVHVIDMHQLTKDPSMLGAARVSSSPDRSMTPFELMRYLDYCSEMLSLTAKLAALYAEKISDPVVVDTVGDIERLTSALSAKIWQKISMAQQLEGRDMPLLAPAPSTSFRTT